MTSFLTVLAGAELAAALPALERLRQRGAPAVCILDAEAAPALPEGICALLPETLLGPGWKDDAFALDRTQFTLLCAVTALQQLAAQGPVWWVHPALLNAVPQEELLPEHIAAWTQAPESWDPRCAGFGAGEAPRAFLRFAAEKIRYAQAQVNYVKFCRLRIPQLLCHWEFFDDWLDYAAYEGCRMQRLPGSAPAAEWTPGAYRWDAFSTGVPVAWQLRELYSRDYRLRFACHGDPFAHQQRFLNETNWTGDGHPVPLTAPMLQLYHARDDLERMFPVLAGDARMAFVQWYLANAGAEYGLPEAYLAPVRAAYERHAAALAEAAVDRRTFAQKVAGKLGRMLGKAPQAAPEPPKPQLPKGVNICGFIQGDFGLGHSSRILADDLASADVPFTMVNYEVPGHTCNSRGWDHKISDRFLYNTNIFVMSPESVRLFVEDVAPDALNGRYNIGYFYWELPEFPDEWVPGLDLMDEIWTASAFTKEAFEKKTRTPVHILPSSIAETKEEGLTRADFGLPEQAFLCLVMYDIQSVAARKNPQGAVRAFQEAFAGREDAGLVLKVNPPRGWDGRDAVLDALRGQPNVYVLAGTYAKPRLNALVSLCDVSVSLHRSEGFGMCPAEAMYWGKPAVLTDWSGNQIYMTPDNCCPVPCEIVEIDQDYGPYKKGCHWAEPDVHAAAAYLRRLAEDPAYYRAVAQRGQETIRTRFSVEAVGKSLRARLAEQGLL